MAFLLDTDLILSLLDEGAPLAAERIARLPGAKKMSIITRVEIEGGLAKTDDVAQVRRFNVISQALQILPFGDADADAYRSIVEALGYSRRRMLDRMIAAQALARSCTLVTLSGDDFLDIPGLDLLEL